MRRTIGIIIFFQLYITSNSSNELQVAILQISLIGIID